MKKKNFNLICGSAITLFVLLFVVVGFFWTPWDPNAMDETARFAGMSFAHPFGCDNFGRDLLSRVMKGGGMTLAIAAATVAVGTFFGVLIGVFISVLGSGKGNVILALGVAFIPSFARIVRGEFIRCKNMDYVKLARLAGAGSLRIMFVHILPNTIQVLLPAVMIGFNNAVLAEAGMSYLGIGVQPPDSSLGRMLSESQSYLFTSPGSALFPGLFLVLMVLGFSLLADGLRERNA